MLGAPLRRDQVVQMCEPRDQHLWAPSGVMAPFHREQLPVDGVRSLIPPRAGHRQTGGFEDRRPAGFRGLNPAPHPRAVGRPRRGGDMGGQVASALAERQDPQARALARPVEPRVELSA
jgi:hypothetical protein